MTSNNVVKMPSRSGLVAQVAQNVRVECAVRGWSQTDLAKAIGVAPNTISKRWYGARQWQLEDLDHLADVMGIPAHRLIVARLEGFEPPTFWSVADAEVYDFASRQRVA